MIGIRMLKALLENRNGLTYNDIGELTGYNLASISKAVVVNHRKGLVWLDNKRMDLGNGNRYYILVFPTDELIKMADIIQAPIMPQAKWRQEYDRMRYHTDEDYREWKKEYARNWNRKNSDKMMEKRRTPHRREYMRKFMRNYLKNPINKKKMNERNRDYQRRRRLEWKAKQLSTS